MTIRGIDLDTAYGEAIQATVAEITGMKFGMDPLTKDSVITIDWNVYSTLADAAGGAPPLIVKSEVHTGKPGDVDFPMTQAQFNKLRSWLYDQIQENVEYAGGTQHLD